MARDVKSMTEEQVLELARDYATVNGYKILKMRKLPHEADYYLRYVLAYNEGKREYATWMLNVQMGGLHLGHYFGHFFDEFEGHTTKDEAYEMALKDFNKR
jgi:hypothetical protein